MAIDAVHGYRYSARLSSPRLAWALTVPTSGPHCAYEWPSLHLLCSPADVLLGEGLLGSVSVGPWLWGHEAMGS